MAYFLSLPPKWFLKDLKQVEFALARVSVWGQNTMLGKINVYGSVTLAANSATTTLTDVRIGAESVILFMATTANAAKAIGQAQGFRGVRLRKSAGQLINTGSTTDATWDTEDFDTDAAHAGSSADVTVPTGVTRAEFFFGSNWGSNNTGTRLLNIRNVTASADLVRDRRSANANSEALVSTGSVGVTAGDVIRAQVNQSSGATLTLESAVTFFSANWLEWGSEFYISNRGTGSLTINHANTPDTDKTFDYCVFV